VDVGRQYIGVVQRPDAHEAECRPATRVVHSAIRHCGQRTIVCPRPLFDGVTTGSGCPDSTSTRLDSISALIANAAPVSRWHQRQWQQWTNSGSVAMR